LRIIRRPGGPARGTLRNNDRRLTTTKRARAYRGQPTK
jgi:hypothetical protein